jgi:hypothetical protein
MLRNGVGHGGITNNFDLYHAVSLPRALVRCVLRSATHVVHGVALRAQALGIANQPLFYRRFGDDDKEFFGVGGHGMFRVLILKIQFKEVSSEILLLTI